MIELMFTTETLLREIGDTKLRQRSVVLTYRLAMLSSERTDWHKVNEAIINRWSVSGLNRIKKMAWTGKGL